MDKLPEPSDITRVVLNAGTLSGLDVLDLGRIEPGALVELADGSIATVLSVEGKRLSAHGVTPGSVQIERGDNQITRVASSDIATVLRPPEPE